jgi:hypothetical protein
VQHSIGLGFEGDNHHSLHDGLHAAHTDPQHPDVHDVHHDGLGDLFHH